MSAHTPSAHRYPPAAPSATVAGSKRKASAVNGDEVRFTKMRELLECPVCYTTMVPPIRQCAEGHHFCDRCCGKLMQASTGAGSRKCPACRVPLSLPVARARSLEQWACEVDLPVQCDACPETYRYSQCAEHKKSCFGRTVACPKKRCCWRGEAAALGAHLEGNERGHKLLGPGAARFSSRHEDYSATVIFESKRPPGDARRWRPPRQLLRIPPNTQLGTSGACFVVALWKAEGANSPVLGSIQALRKPGNDETPFQYDLSLSAYARGASHCVSRASAVGPVAELDATEVWKRPGLSSCGSAVLVAPAVSLRMFNTAGLSVNRNRESRQRYELHVRLIPITRHQTERQAAVDADDEDDEAYVVSDTSGSDEAQAPMNRAFDRFVAEADAWAAGRGRSSDGSDAEEEGDESSSDGSRSNAHAEVVGETSSSDSSDSDTSSVDSYSGGLHFNGFQ